MKKSIVNIKGVEVLNKKQQSQVNGGTLAEYCDSNCGSASTSATFDILRDWVCGC